VAESIFSGQYEGSYEGFYEGSYAGDYSTAYTGTYITGEDFYEGIYSAGYEGSYEASYAGLYSGTYSQAYSLKIGDVNVVTSGGHATLSSSGTSDSPSTVTTRSSGSVEATVTSGGGVSVVGGFNQPGKSVTTRIASDDTVVHLGIIDLENLKVDLKPAAVEEGSKPSALGSNTQPFGDLYLQGNTLTLSTRSLGITEIDGHEYFDFGSNTIIGATHITGDKLLAFADQLKISQLTDVNITGVQDGQILKWDAAASRWTPGQYVDTIDISGLSIEEHADVAAFTPADNDVFQFDSGLGKWTAVSPSGILDDAEFLSPKAVTVNSYMQMVTTRVVASSAGTHVVDQFSINTYRSAKYLVQVEDNTFGDKGYWIAEVLMTHNDTDSALTVWGEVELGTVDMSPTVTTDITSGLCRLKVATGSDDQTVTASRFAVTKTS